MSQFDKYFLQELEQAASNQVKRQLRCIIPYKSAIVEYQGRRLINFSSNDYLGLAQHPALVQRANEWGARYGVGSQSSRLICGNYVIHSQLEAKIAKMKGTEAAILLSSGWQANASVIPALIKAISRRSKPFVYSDRLNHASLHHGCQAAQIRQIRFKHNDLNDLEQRLSANKNQSEASFIVTESVFSMDGDRLDILNLIEIAKRYKAFVYLDEAHATGVLGVNGMGLSTLIEGQVNLVMGTFSKAMGSFGSYIAGSRTMCDYLINKCSGFIYSTALPPPILGAIDAALDLIPNLLEERNNLIRQSDRLRAGLNTLGINTAQSSTQIIPAIIGDAQRSIIWSKALEQSGFLVTAIRPPTVPHGTSRLRITINAAHKDKDIDALLNALAHIIETDASWEKTSLC